MTNAEKKRIKEVIAKTVKDEVRDYRELRHYIESEARNAMLGVVGLLSMFSVCGAILGFFGKDYIVEIISEKALGKVTAMVVQTETDKMLKTEVAGVISNRVPVIIDERVPEMISNKVDIVERDMRTRLSDQTAMFAVQQSNVTERISLMNTMLAASMGSRPDYDRLCQFKKSPGEDAALIVTTIDSINQRYTLKALRREDCPLMYLADSGTQTPPEVYAQIIHMESGISCNAAVNALVKLGRKDFVETLVYAVEHAKHLDTVYLAIIGIGDLTGEKFPALGVDEVRQWWSKNSTNEVYCNEYERQARILERQEVERNGR